MPFHKAADAEEVQRSLGRRIRDLRSQRGWSQEQFAGVCGLHRTYMGHVERGEKNVSLSTVLRVAGGLGVRLPELFGPVRSRSTAARSPQVPSRRRAAAFGLTGLEVMSVLDELQVQRKALRQAVRNLTELWKRGLGPGSLKGKGGRG